MKPSVHASSLSAVRSRPEPTPGVAAEHLCDAVASMDDGFFVLDRNWRYVYVNQAGCELIGKPLDQVLGQSLWDLVPGLRGTDFEQEYLRAMAGRVTVRFEARYEPHDAWFKIHAYPSGEYLAVIARDITARYKAQSSLHDSEARHRAIVQAVPELMLWIDSDGWVLNADMHGSHPLCHACEVTDAAGIVRCHLGAVFSPEVAARVSEAVARAIETSVTDEIDFQFTSPDREVNVFEARIVPVDSRSVVMVVQDVSERRKLELEVLRISEEVYRDVGRDLHDGLGSHLTGVAMLARRLARDAHKGQPPSAEAIEELAALITEGNEQARALAYGLNPIVIEREGLCAALHALVGTVESLGGPRSSLVSEAGDGAEDARSECCPAGFPKLDLPVATHLYRVAQEAIHNAVRHAAAGEIKVCLAHRDDHVVLSIADDGSGFSPDAQAGMGIRVMRYRARLIGASLSIQPGPDGGTIVVCALPVTDKYDFHPIPVSYAIPDLCC
jgi:PAS domain S-box-containing protein